MPEFSYKKLLMVVVGDPVCLGLILLTYMALSMCIALINVNEVVGNFFLNIDALGLVIVSASINLVIKNRVRAKGYQLGTGEVLVIGENSLRIQQIETVGSNILLISLVALLTLMGSVLCIITVR